MILPTCRRIRKTIAQAIADVQDAIRAWNRYALLPYASISLCQR